jgi:plasmid stabilization system protein ParE
MTALIVSADARTDTFEILEGLKNKAGASVSARYAMRFRDVVARLPEMPRSGSPRPALGSSTRCIIVSPYAIIYDYVEKDDLIVILRILHGRRNISKEAGQK